MKTKDFVRMPGWGSETNLQNDPTYPIKKYTGDDHRRMSWARPIQQPVKTEVLRSNERPVVSAVFGTTLPPKGLSGVIRRLAFRYSESSYGHWLPLLLADRINVVEGVISDLLHFRIPNFFAETGWKAEWKFRPGRLILKLSLIIAVLGGITAWIVVSIID